MENPPSEDVFPTSNGGFSNVMLAFRGVYVIPKGFGWLANSWMNFEIPLHSLKLTVRPQKWWFPIGMSWLPANPLFSGANC